GTGSRSGTGCGRAPDRPRAPRPVSRRPPRPRRTRASHRRGSRGPPRTRGAGTAGGGWRLTGAPPRSAAPPPRAPPPARTRRAPLGRGVEAILQPAAGVGVALLGQLGADDRVAVPRHPAATDRRVEQRVLHRAHAGRPCGCRWSSARALSATRSSLPVGFTG